MEILSSVLRAAKRNPKNVLGVLLVGLLAFITLSKMFGGEGLSPNTPTEEPGAQGVETPAAVEAPVAGEGSWILKGVYVHEGSGVTIDVDSNAFGVMAEAASPPPGSMFSVILIKTGDERGQHSCWPSLIYFLQDAGGHWETREDRCEDCYTVYVDQSDPDSTSWNQQIAHCLTWSRVKSVARKQGVLPDPGSAAYREMISSAWEEAKQYNFPVVVDTAVQQ